MIESLVDAVAARCRTCADAAQRCATSHTTRHPGLTNTSPLPHPHARSALETYNRDLEVWTHSQPPRDSGVGAACAKLAPLARQLRAVVDAVHVREPASRPAAESWLTRRPQSISSGMDRLQALGERLQGVLDGCAPPLPRPARRSLRFSRGSRADRTGSCLACWTVPGNDLRLWRRCEGCAGCRWWGSGGAQSVARAALQAGGLLMWAALQVSAQMRLHTPSPSAAWASASASASPSTITPSPPSASSMGSAHTKGSPRVLAAASAPSGAPAGLHASHAACTPSRYRGCSSTAASASCPPAAREGEDGVRPGCVRARAREAAHRRARPRTARLGGTW